MKGRRSWVFGGDSAQAGSRGGRLARKRLLGLLVALLLLAARAEAVPPHFAYTELPTLSGGPDVPIAVATVGANQTITVGAAQTVTVGASKAVAWECTGATCALVELPSAESSLATGVFCEATTDCIAVGWFEDTGGQHQPVAWLRTAGSWSAETLPLPSGQVTGEALAVTVDASGRAAACGTTASATNENSSCWVRVAQTWSSVPLPGLGAGLASAALEVATLPSDGNTLVAAGRAQDAAGRVLPVLWQEQIGGTFAGPTTLPLSGSDDANATGVEAIDPSTYLVTGTGFPTTGEVGLLWRVSVAGGDPDRPIIVGSVPNTTSVVIKGKKILQNFAAFPGATDGASGARGALFLWDLVAPAPEYFDLNELVDAPPGVVIASGNGVAIRDGTSATILIAEAQPGPTRAVLLVETSEIPALPGAAPALLLLAVLLAAGAVIVGPAARGRH